MFEVRPAGFKGLGIFATSLIPRGTRILSERPLFGVARDQGPRDVYPAFRQLDAKERLRFLQLSSHATTEFEVVRWAHVAWYTARRAGEIGLSRLLGREVRLPWIWSDLNNLREHRAVLNIFRTNAFSLNATSRFSQAIFPRIARLNHACVPNAQGNFNDDMGVLNVHAVRDIEPGKEVLLSYLDDTTGLLKGERAQQLQSYGFDCACSICDSKSELATPSLERRSQIRQAMSAFARDYAMLDESLRSEREIEVLLLVIGLLREEGFAGREMAAMYLEAARLCEESGRWQDAVRYAEEGLRYDRICLGTDHPTFKGSAEKVERLKSLLATR